MKKVISFYCVILFLLISTFVSVAAASEDTDAVNSFKQYASDNVLKIKETYKGNHYRVSYIQKDNYPNSPPAYWLKISSDVDSNYKIDVQKTTSLISPYIGTLEITRNNVFYRHAATRELAEITTDIDKVTTDVTYKFTVAFQDGNWNVTSAVMYDPFLGRWFNTKTLDVFEELRCKDEKH